MAGSEDRVEPFLKVLKKDVFDFVVPYVAVGDEVEVGRSGRVSERS